MKEAMTILIADESQIFREGMMAVLQNLVNVDRVYEASTPEEVQKLISKTDVDIALVDLMIMVDQKHNLLINYDGSSIKTRVIALATGYDEEKFNRLLNTGVSGFLLKSISKEELCAALEIVSGGKSYFSHEISNEIIKRNYAQPAPPRRRGDIFSLTKREMEILKLLCEDMSNDEISRILFISPRTVDGHRSNIINKLGVKGKVGLVKYALKNNLITN